MQNERTSRTNNHIKLGIIQKHINNNLKNYIILIAIFLCGIILGVLYINNANNNQANEINVYIQNFIEKTKDNASIDYTKLLLDSIKNNLSLAILLWFVGLTVIGVIAVYGIVVYRGFCLRIQCFKYYCMSWSKERKHFCIIKYVTAKCNIYTMYFCNFNKPE